MMVTSNPATASHTTPTQATNNARANSSAAHNAAENPASPGPSPKVIMTVAAFACLVVTLLQSLVVPAIPRFPQILGVSATAVSWLVTATLLVGAAATPILGRMADMLPRRQLMAITMGLVFVGSVIAPLGGITTLIIGRALQGLGTAIVPVAMAHMRHSLPPRHIASALALLSATLGIGGGLGIPLGGVLLSSYGWTSMFIAASILSGAATLALWFLLPNQEDENQPRGFDYLGAVLLTLALSAILTVLSQGELWGWTSPLVIILVIAAIVISFLWGKHELGASSPLVDVRTARRLPILLTNIASIFMGIAMFTNLLLTTLELQNPVAESGFEWSARAAGLAMLPSAAVMFLVAPLSARLAHKVGPLRLLAIGAAITGVGYLLRIVLGFNPWLVIVAATIVALGVGIAYAAMPMVMVDYNPKSEIGSANAVNALMRAIGMALSSAIVTAITTAFSATVADHHVPSALALNSLAIFGIALSVASAALVLIAAVKETR